MTRFTAVMVLAASLAGGAWAQAFQPTRPIEIVVHNAPGGGSDLLARFIGTLVEKEKLLPVRNQIHNRPGGGGAVAMAYMAEKRGDPHTIALYTSVWLLTPMLSAEATVGFYDMTPIARLVLESTVIAVKADSPYRTLQDFIEGAKKEPGRLKQAGGSVQTRGNFVRLLLQKATGARWVYISFPGGGERIAALLGGHVQLIVAEPQEAREYLRNGSLRALAQITEKRLPGFAEVPTLREAGFNVPSDPTMRGVVAPPGTAKNVAAYWEEVFARMVQTQGWRNYLEENLLVDGFERGEQVLKSSNEFAARMREVLKEAGLKVYR